MPRNDSVEILKSPYVDRSKQVPLTAFLPMENMIVQCSGVHVPPWAVEFIEACHKGMIGDPRFSEEELLAAVSEGKGLWQCGEIIKIGFRISNVSRILTHQLVRARIGVSFSQQCTGDVDCRHLPFVYPLCFDGRARYDYEQVCLSAKTAYVSLIDDYGYSIQEARYALPQGLTSFIYMDIALSSLVQLYRKRCCTMTQTWEMYVFARSLRAAVLETAPWLKPLFPLPSEVCKNCWFQHNKTTDFAVTHLWAPDAAHDNFEWNAASFVHGAKSHAEVSGARPYEADGVSLFLGEDQVDQETYDDWAISYGLYGSGH